MRSLWLWLWLLVMAVGLGSIVVASSNPDPGAWVPLMAGSLFITLAILMAVGLRIPQLGQPLLGSAWPGQFAEREQRRLATYAALTWLSGYGLFGSTVVMSAYHPDGIVWTGVALGLTLLSFLCFLVAWRWRRALLQP